MQLVQADCRRLIGPEGSPCAACTGRLQAPDWARGLTMCSLYRQTAGA